ncbi:methyltransferase domain-containing protein [Rubellimicrobium arenae]|uniref:methyltransferase domain-containing protein n=1 Tax=Rubellimicrobium arenae TaxID=2817372 RepID=UPI001B31184C|nr:methyltransferase domain-containing protein [Rubellimicrobium arenae]
MDWDPGTYRRFRGLRLRPALDLLLQVGEVPDGCVVDLGCGDGAVAGPLRARFPGHRILGVDSSPEMLGHATGYDATRLVDIAHWTPEEPPAVVFSNAALHWLSHHEMLFPRLAQCLAPGGVLAVQMPRQFDAPSHRLLRDLAEGMFPDRFSFTNYVAPVAPPAAYHRLLSPLGAVDLWETEYLQPLSPVPEGHPVRAFTQSTALRPFAARMGEGELQEFLDAYDDSLRIAYPAEADGSVLFPFRRLFLVLTRGD